MGWRWAWSVLGAGLLLTAACGTSDPIADPEPVVTTAAGIDLSTVQDQAEPDAASGTDGAAGADRGEEPRFDELPLPADLDQVEDVFRSLLGPTEDFVTQVRRVAPDYRQLPTPAGAEIIAVRISYAGLAGDPAVGGQHGTSVRMLSTTAPDELTPALQQMILAENPDWVPEDPSSSDPAAGGLLRFDLPDVEQPGGEQNLTPDLQIRVDPSENGGSEVTIRTTEPGPELATPNPYSGWQDELPAPEGTEHWAGSINVDGPGKRIWLASSHRVTSAGLADYRDTYLELLAQRGLTVESEVPEREGIELTVTGHPRFATLTIGACCTENRYITETTHLAFRTTIDL